MATETLHTENCKEALRNIHFPNYLKCIGANAD